MPYFAPSFKQKVMAKNNHQKSATCGTTREQYVTRESENGAVVYDNFMGFPYQVSFLGGQWWVTMPGEPLQPLNDLLDDDISYNYLCASNGRVGALALAKMLGKTIEEPECDVCEAMRQRVACLKRLGVTVDVNDERLTLELRVFENPEKSCRRGEFSVWCHATDCFYDMLFDIDGFSSEGDAEEWVSYYFDFLRDLGIDFTVTKYNKV